MDIRYNVINWVHRSTRGWSSGATVTDPRTGEILKGVVTLGSLRVRQDWMIAEGLLQPYRNGDEATPEIRAWALQRMRQLSAHEVGHTLGLGHNYYDSDAGRISVMDYPHPLVTLRADGTLDHSQVYTNGIGEWDKVAIAYGYQDFPDGANEPQALQRILDQAWTRDIRYMTNQDMGAHARVNQWSNGTDAAAELTRMLAVRRAALSRFGENAIKRGMPMAQIEEVLVPLYLHHRYQVDAAANVVGGMHYIYAMRGDGREPVRMASAAEQRAALNALMASISPSALALPTDLLKKIPPRPSGYGRSRELFPRYTGLMFDAVSPAVAAADHVVGMLLASDRAARLVEQKAIDPSLPGLEDVIDALFNASFGATASTPYEAEVKRAVERVVVDELMDLAGSAPMSQVRAVATLKLQRRGHRAGSRRGGGRSRRTATAIESDARAGEPPRRGHQPLPDASGQSGGDTIRRRRPRRRERRLVNRRWTGSVAGARLHVDRLASRGSAVEGRGDEEHRVTGELRACRSSSSRPLTLCPLHLDDPNRIFRSRRRLRRVEAVLRRHVYRGGARAVGHRGPQRDGQDHALPAADG